MARAMRKKGATLQEIAEYMKITRAGARWLIKRSDDFLGPPQIGNYKDYKRWIHERNKSL